MSEIRGVEYTDQAPCRDASEHLNTTARATAQKYTARPQACPTFLVPIRRLDDWEKSVPARAQSPLELFKGKTIKTQGLGIRNKNIK